MARTQVKTVPADRLREELEALPGVRRAIVDGPPLRALLVCEPTLGSTPLELEAAAREALATLGLGEDEVALEVAYLDAPPSARRVRFVDIQVERPRVGSVEASVALEWAGRTYRGEAEGEGGSACEIRVCALAAVRALEGVLDGGVSFSLVGTKAIRIFDNDLVSALLHSPQSPERKLIGVSLVAAGDANRSAALAVLNATNRLLGNYLATTD